MLFKDQRLLMTEMDKFVVTLKPGKNTVTRESKDSSVTIPFDRTFRDLGNVIESPVTHEDEKYNYCGCGWPDHMLVPKGTPEGLECQLFVMISNYDDDEVKENSKNPDLCDKCTRGASFCGLRDYFYPDLRSMGFPFDRLTEDQRNDKIWKLLRPNMNLSECKIIHVNQNY